MDQEVRKSSEQGFGDPKSVLQSMVVRWPPDKKARFYADPEFEELIIDVGLKFNRDLGTIWMDRVARVLLAIPPEDTQRAKALFSWISCTLPTLISSNLTAQANDTLEGAMKIALTSGNLAVWLAIVPKGLDLEITVPSFFPTLQEAKALRDKYAKVIFENYDNLRRLMQTSEKEIQNRWARADAKGRAKILRQVWPAISAKHLSHVRDIMKHNKPPDAACLWPHINVEGLSQSDNLLGFLDSRTRQPPWMFFWLDKESWAVAAANRYVQAYWLSEHLMEVTGKDTVDDYCNITTGEQMSDAKFKIWPQFAARAGDGLTTMVVQAHIYSFLFDCCLVILDETKAQFQASHNHLDPASPLGNSTVQLKPTSTVDALIKFPYRVPRFDQLDLETLIQNVAATRDFARAHYLSLRRDPAYFAQALKDLSEHRLEHVQVKAYVVENMNRRPPWDKRKDPHRGKHPILSDEKSHPLFWNYVLIELVKETLWKLILFDDLHDRLVTIYNSFDPSNPTASLISPDKELPKHVFKELGHLLYRLTLIICPATEALGDTIAASPLLREQFWIYPKPPSQTKYLIERRKPLTIVDKPSDVSWLIDTLVNTGPNRKVPFVLMISLLHHAMENSQASLTNYIYGLVADIGLLSEILNTLELLHPWSLAVQHDFSQNHSSRDDLSQDFRDFQGVIYRISSYLSLTSSATGMFDLASHLCDTSPDDIYPTEGKHKVEVAALRKKSENALAQFWKKVDGQLRPILVEYPIVEDAHEIEQQEQLAESAKVKNQRPKKKKSKKGKEIVEPGMEEDEEDQEEEQQQEMIQEYEQQDEPALEEDENDVQQTSDERYKKMWEEEWDKAWGGEQEQEEEPEKAETSKKGHKRQRDAEIEAPNKAIKIGDKKVKVKTRGIADPARAASSTPQPTQTPEPEPEPIVFYVKKKNDMKVWRAMFAHDREGGGPPGKFSFTSFIQAMRNIGFKDRDVGGSVVSFTPPDVLAFAGNILFHRTHPEKSVSLIKARMMGYHFRSHYKYRVDYDSFKEV